MRRQLDEQFGPDCPVATNAIKVAELSQDSILYVAHPVRSRKKVLDKRTGREVWRKTLELFVSQAVDVNAECTESPRRGAKIVDYNKLQQCLHRATRNDPTGWFFVPHLSGWNKADFSEATIQLLTR